MNEDERGIMRYMERERERERETFKDTLTNLLNTDDFQQVGYITVHHNTYDTLHSQRAYLANWTVLAASEVRWQGADGSRWNFTCPCLMTREGPDPLDQTRSYDPISC